MPNKWTSEFADLEPLAHELKLRFPERWVRFHSLPASKRYPECDSEFETLLTRFNTVLGELAREREEVVLLTTEFSASRTPTTAPSITASSHYWRTAVVLTQ